MMKVKTDKKCLVRGYVIYAQWGAGCLGMEEARDDSNVRVGVAYTMWHRTDDVNDVKDAEKELEMLSRLYSKFHAYEGALIGFEYRDFDR